MVFLGSQYFQPMLTEAPSCWDIVTSMVWFAASGWDI
jgi:hypothetical protein